MNENPVRAEPLERAYRRLLRAYPRRWRVEREDEVLGVLLDSAEETGRSRPSAREGLDLIVHGLGARAGAALAPVPRRLRERVAVLSLAGGAAMAALCLVQGEVPPRPHTFWMVPVTSPGPFLTFDVLVYLGWLVALALGVAGRSRAVRYLCAGTGLATALLAGLAQVTALAVVPLHLSVFLIGLSLLAAQAPAPLNRGQRPALAGGAAGFAGVLLLMVGWPAGILPGWQEGWLGGRHWAFYRSSGAGIEALSRQTWVLLLGALVVGLVVRRYRPGWLLAILVAALPWTYLWTLFATGENTPSKELPVLVFAALALGVGGLATAYQFGRRSASSRAEETA